MKKLLLAAVAVGSLIAGAASATPFTRNSPTGGGLPGGVTEVGGIVLDLKGLSGTRVVTQLAASSLYVGFANSGTPVGQQGNPLTIGTQTGFNASVLAALGGGLSSASVRITLFDGDSAPGDFDDGNANTLLLDGVDFGFWSAPTTQQTNNTGTMLLSTTTGFGDDILSTGFFTNSNAASLASLFTNLADGSVAFLLRDDRNPFDNFYDFTQGVDGGLINVGTGPIVTPPSGVPEPATWAMMIVGFGLVGAAARRRRSVPLAA